VHARLLREVPLWPGSPRLAVSFSEMLSQYEKGRYRRGHIDIAGEQQFKFIAAAGQNERRKFSRLTMNVGYHEKSVTCATF